MSDLNELMAQIPLDQLARQLGVDEAEAEQLARRALPALIGGMEANAQDPRGAASLAKALAKHDDGLLDGGVDLEQVDADDGDKIVSHVFGDNKNQVISQLGGLGGGDGMMSKVLPLLAPLVLSWLAKSFTQGGQKSGSDAGGLGGLGDLLGGLLGGKGGGSSDIGDLLGGLLGGGRR